MWNGLTFDLDRARLEPCLAVEQVVVVLTDYGDDGNSG